MEVVGQLFDASESTYAQGDSLGTSIVSFCAESNAKCVTAAASVIMVRQSLEGFVGRGRLVLVVVAQLDGDSERL
jgi:hypothetical protein